MPAALNIPNPPLMYGPTRRSTYPITAGQTFKAGDPVYLVAAGTLSICATSGNDVGNIQILGHAAGDAEWLLSKGYDCEVMIPLSGFTILTQLYHSTAASAVLAAAAYDAPTTLPLRNQGGRWVANVETDGTNDRLVILERHNQYLVTEQYTWVWAAYLESGLLFGGQ